MKLTVTISAAESSGHNSPYPPNVHVAGRISPPIEYPTTKPDASVISTCCILLEADVNVGPETFIWNPPTS